MIIPQDCKVSLTMKKPFFIVHLRSDALNLNFTEVVSPGIFLGLRLGNAVKRLARKVRAVKRFKNKYGI